MKLRIAGLLAFSLLSSLSAQAGATGKLESPKSNSYASGIDLVRGWHCSANIIEVQFDNGPRYKAAQGTLREDTTSTCGDADNGFGLVFNYNKLGDGQHRVRVFADNVEFGNVQFQVVTLGSEYQKGLSARTYSDFISVGKRAKLQWDESRQNFSIVGIENFPFDANTLINRMQGQWSGTWTSWDRQYTGTANITLSSLNGGKSIAITSTAITGSECPSTMSGSTTIDLSTPIFEAVIVFTDGSTALLQAIPTLNYEALSGVFSYLSGPCSGDTVVFSLF